METSRSFSQLESYKSSTPIDSSCLFDEEDVATLVKSIVSGESEKYEIIIERYRDKVLRIAWRLSGNYEDTLDISQEAFLRIFRALRSWKGHAKFSTWLHRVALNTALDYIRWQGKHSRGRVIDYDEETHNILEKINQGVERSTPFEKAHQSELKRLVYRAIVKLSPMQRKCFVLRYYQDLKIREVAEVLGVKDGTVKRHLFRGAKRLRLLLNEI